MKIALIDDTINDALNIKELIESFFTENTLNYSIDIFNSGEDFTKNFTKGRYDIIFCDIYMKTLSGIDTARKVRTADSDVIIIFITMSNSYAAESYEVGAYSYITKPVNKDRLYSLMYELLRKTADKSRQFNVTLRDKPFLNLSIPYDKIMYINIVSRKVYLHMPDKTIAIDKSITQCCSELLNDKRFSNCCKGIIVNFEYVSRILDNDFIMCNSDRVPIRKRYSSEIKNTYMSYKLQNIIKEKL